MVRWSVERARRVRRIEAAALGLLAILPIVPYLTFLLRIGVPRFGLFGDLAVVEHTTRRVFMGDVVIGEPSRFAFSQPGPLFFYLAAPFEALFAPAATGLYVAAALVNGASSAAIVASARLFARRAHALAALVVVLAWYVAFGSVAASPWMPFVVVLPLLAFLFNAAMLARGKSAAAYPAMFFGTLAAQTHVVAVPVVLAVTLASVAMIIVTLRRRERGKPNPDAVVDPTTERWRLILAAGIAFFFFIPPLVDQLLAPTGNMRLIAGFFFHRETPLVRLGTAVKEWMTMTGWVPYRIRELTILHEGFVPLLASNDEMFLGATSFPALVAAIHVIGGAAAALLALKRKDRASLALLAIGALADALAVLTLQHVVGTSTPWLVFWTTASSAVLWMGVFSSVFSAVGAQLLKLKSIRGAAATPLIFVALAAAVTTASLQRFALAKHPAAIGSHPELRADVHVAYDAVRARLLRDGSTPVIHPGGASDIALAFFDELEKDNVDVRVPASEPSHMTAAFSDAGVPKPLHLWFASATARGKLAACTDTVAKSGDLVVLSGCP